MMMFQEKIPSRQTKVSGCRTVFAVNVGPLVIPASQRLMCRVFACAADMIYEDVQRDSGPVQANNGWSSSEFESYDEQSDNEAKLPARSKVACV